MRRLSFGINKTNSFFISVLAISLVSGCVREATSEQFAVAKQQNVFLGEGYSTAYYPVNLQQAMDATGQVMAAHNGIPGREYVFITDSSRPKGQWIERRGNSQVQESGKTITAYMCRWSLLGKYYDITITSESSSVKVVIDPVLTIWCVPADYDTYISLHQTFQDKLKVKGMPVPESNTKKSAKPKSKI
jgi:hypothetical protein